MCVSELVSGSKGQENIACRFPTWSSSPGQRYHEGPVHGETSCQPERAQCGKRVPSDQQQTRQFLYQSSNHYAQPSSLLIRQVTELYKRWLDRIEEVRLVSARRTGPRLQSVSSSRPDVEHCGLLTDNPTRKKQARLNLNYAPKVTSDRSPGVERHSSSIPGAPRSVELMMQFGVGSRSSMEGSAIAL
ncbi:hypothetical protein R1flu_018575 [Riccia fluitans]|uniref:Uncharacterized protein n=1 Tax=Riccia fluitans TaxID=41844 RepID=A0ABD1ZG81_9MARC